MKHATCQRAPMLPGLLALAAVMCIMTSPMASAQATATSIANAEANADNTAQPPAATPAPATPAPAPVAPETAGATAVPEPPAEENRTVGQAQLPPFFAIRSCVAYNILVVPPAGGGTVGSTRMCPLLAAWIMPPSPPPGPMLEHGGMACQITARSPPAPPARSAALPPASYQHAQAAADCSFMWQAPAAQLPGTSLAAPSVVYQQVHACRHCLAQYSESLTSEMPYHRVQVPGPAFEHQQQQKAFPTTSEGG
eukprot:CAMPEP_0202863912 /NCGR_PEP_ID=MMETSP1391-20130828/4358_1 /ASSEMBLY_ACC=CAM_ASM_000867 /TAXON_ID=1034604 /ORGANISM="Chlamydomonas leiostraca, Strain SAG 11-49" /LENGTH=252 /DNA_ID=CAMNT_0049543597 /DNA_START=123 /DNA_END=880 /DNA_ORIENTATION=-